jgi:fluoride exporter
MADHTPKRISKRDSEFQSIRASHGSASDHQPWMETFGAFQNSSEVAAPKAAAFYDQGRIKRNTSFEDTPTRKSNRRRDKSATWPKPEHSSPSASASSAPKTPPNLSSQDEHSPPFSFEELDEVASPPPIENRNDEGTYLHSTLEARNQFLAGERSSSRRAKTKIRPRKDVTKLAPSTPSSQGIHEIGSPGPGSSGKEDATALPQYSFSQDNLEEQLTAARASQMNSPVLNTPTPQHRKASRLATQLYTVSYLIFFSIFGTLARLGLQWLTFYPGAPVVTSVLWSNFGGSLILGWLIEDRRLFREEWSSHSSSSPSFGSKNVKSRETFITGRQHRSQDDPDAVAQHSRVKKTIPLYIGLTVGFCGSFTSFSSFMRDAFLSLSNNLPTPQNHSYPNGFSVPATTSTIHRDSGYSVLALLAIIISTLSLSLSGLKLGAHIAISLDPWTPTIRFTILRKFFDRIIVFLGLGCWLGAIFLSVFGPNTRWRGDALFAVVFAPLGCLSRFYVSLWLNDVSPSFPLGTFVVNIFGTAVEAMSFNLQHVTFSGAIGGGRIPCQVLQGVMDGYCGAFTTVSTFVAELQGLRRTHAYVYGSASVVGGLVMVIAVMGGVRWGVGWEGGSCLA